MAIFRENTYKDKRKVLDYKRAVALGGKKRDELRLRAGHQSELSIELDEISLSTKFLKCIKSSISSLIL